MLTDEDDATSSSPGPHSSPLAAYGSEVHSLGGPQFIDMADFTDGYGSDDTYQPSSPVSEGIRRTNEEKTREILKVMRGFSKFEKWS